MSLTQIDLKPSRETAARLRRLEAMQKLTTMGAQGDFDKGIAAYEARKEACREQSSGR